MGVIQKAYTPINCAFHDYLEHFATLRQQVCICFQDETTSNIETIEAAVIYDLTGGRNGEFTHIRFAQGEKKVRNDYIISVNDIKAADFLENNCGI